MNIWKTIEVGGIFNSGNQIITELEVNDCIVNNSARDILGYDPFSDPYGDTKFLVTRIRQKVNLVRVRMEEFGEIKTEGFQYLFSDVISRLTRSQGLIPSPPETPALICLNYHDHPEGEALLCVVHGYKGVFCVSKNKGRFILGYIDDKMIFHDLVKWIKESNTWLVFRKG